MTKCALMTLPIEGIFRGVIRVYSRVYNIITRDKALTKAFPTCNKLTASDFYLACESSVGACFTLIKIYFQDIPFTYIATTTVGSVSTRYL